MTRNLDELVQRLDAAGQSPMPSVFVCRDAAAAIRELQKTLLDLAGVELDCGEYKLRAEAAEAKLAELQAENERIDNERIKAEREWSKHGAALAKADEQLAELQAQKPVYWIEYGPEGMGLPPEHIIDGIGVSTMPHRVKPTRISNGNGLLELYAKPVPAVDLAEFKREAMRLADAYRYSWGSGRPEVEARAAMQSHLDKLGGK